MQGSILTRSANQHLMDVDLRGLESVTATRSVTSDTTAEVVCIFCFVYLFVCVCFGLLSFQEALFCFTCFFFLSNWRVSFLAFAYKRFSLFLCFLACFSAFLLL